MARFVYIDETGTGAKQPFLTIAAALVDEQMVQPLAAGLRRVAMTHLGWLPADFEFHGKEIWHGTKHLLVRSGPISVDGVASPLHPVSRRPRRPQISG